MFDPDLYRKTCSEGMELPEETLEEMIFMTENKKRGLRKPLQIALTAAALAVVMCVTAAAANPEAVEKLWKSFTVSVIYQDENTKVVEKLWKSFTVSIVHMDDDTMIVSADMPQIDVQRENDRVILTIDGEKTDITEALDRDGVCVQHFETEHGTAELTVQSDLTWGLTMPLENNGEFSCNSSDQAEVYYSEDLGVTPEGFDTYTFTDDETRTDAIYLPPEE